MSILEIQTSLRHSSHSTLKLTKVNTFALWYEWAGSDPSLKPVLLTAHQGVYLLTYNNYILYQRIL